MSGDLRELLGRPGATAVLLGGSRNPNAKVALVLLDRSGPTVVVKAPTTDGAAEAVRTEGDHLARMHELPLGELAATLPRPMGYIDVSGRPALVTTALAGVPMTVRYHGWRHLARRGSVTGDFAAAASWLATLQAKTAGAPETITLLDESVDLIRRRFADYPGLPQVVQRLAEFAADLACHSSPRTVVHGDYWFGNILLGPDPRTVVGVVDWEAGRMRGEPLRDGARFAVSYALYLDRHVRRGARIPGHGGLRADMWGAGLSSAMDGRGWFGEVVYDYLRSLLHRLSLPPDLARHVMIAGIADVAATADHPEFAIRHLDVLARGLIPALAR